MCICGSEYKMGQEVRMISLQKETMNIRFEKPELDHFIDAAFLFLLCIMFTFNHPGVGLSALYYTLYFLFVGLSLVKVLLRIRLDGVVMVSGVTIWYLLFSLYSFSTALWSDYPDEVFGSIVRMLQIIVLIFFVSQTYATPTAVKRCLKMISWAASFCVVFIFVNTPVDEWLSGQLGMKLTGQNPNTIGMILTVTTLVTAYFAYYEKQRLYYLFTFIQFAAAVLTSSRKTVIAVCIGFIMLIFLKDKSFKLLLRMLFAVGAVVGVFYAIMNIPELYAAIGYRFESMFDYLMQNDVDNSLFMRQTFIDAAKQFFFEHPLVGSGAHSFSQMIVDIAGKSTYAHNNYYEVLVDFGLIGFAIYYSMYAYLVIKLIRPVFKEGNNTAKLMLTLMAVILVSEYGIVLYYAVYNMIFITTVFMFVSAYDKGGRQACLRQHDGVFTARERTI